jgi:hypothetical protein
VGGRFSSIYIAQIRIDGSTPHREIEHLPEFEKGIANEPDVGYGQLDSN